MTRAPFLAGLTALLLLLPARSPAQQGSGDSTRVIMLGVGSPNISADRAGTGIAVVVRGTAYLFDAGPGVEHRIFEARQRLNIPMRRFGPVFITHLHSDHTLGLPALLYYARNPREPFHVIGPPGTRAMMQNILAAWVEDIRFLDSVL